MSTGKKVWLIVGIAVSVLLTVAIGLGAFLLLTGKIGGSQEAAAVKQVTLQDDQLQSTVQQVEYAALSQWMDSYQRHSYLTDSPYSPQAYIGDLEGNGHIDLITDGPCWVFSLDQQNGVQRTTRYLGVEDGNIGKIDPVCEIRIDNQNRLYRLHVEDGGAAEDGHFWSEDFCRWDGQSWTPIMCISHKELNGVDEITYIIGETNIYVNGKNVTEQEWNQHLAALGFTYPKAIADLSLVSVYGDCRQQLTNALVSHFSNDFAGDMISRQTDYDGDGQVETMIVLPSLYQTWYDSIPAECTYWLERYAQAAHNTAVLIVDSENEKTIVRCCVANEAVRGNSFVLEKGHLNIDGSNFYLPGMAINDYSAMQIYLKNRYADFTADYVISADLSEADGNEMVFFGAENGEYGAYVVGVHEGKYFCSPYYRNALYLVNVGGKQHLMRYYTDNYADGGSYYFYNLTRVDSVGKMVIVEENEYDYHPTQQDATAAANFFNRFNAYTNNMTVVYDPYRLTGQQWVTPDNATYGTPPDEPMDATGEQLGYVQIKDPKSWLNLREGPGTNYPCVYLEPGNKKSIVKQAQGSPVTILETINTGDAKNPVWYKVRINYAGREIVGYSSQTFIRLANE